MNEKPSLFRIELLLTALLMLACASCTASQHNEPDAQKPQGDINPTLQPTYTSNPTYTPQPTFTPYPTYTPRPTYTLLPLISPTPLDPADLMLDNIPTPGAGELSQFASEASASSQYSSPGWSAEQATGAPDTYSCGHQSSAWVSRNPYGTDWLLLTYEQPVIPSTIVIYQTYNPGAIFLVELVDEAGKSITVYSAPPHIVSQCPFNLEIEVKDVNTPVRSVRVTLNQANTAGWNEIDAVQLIGKP
jgi:hypothetical protein